MKKAFTLAEVLVTLTILGIVMAITIPVLNHTRPEKDPIYYKKGIQTIQSAMHKIMDSEEINNNIDDEGRSLYLKGMSLCSYFIDYLNISGQSDCDSESTYASPNFITTDGIRFWGFEKEFSDADNEITVYLDRKFSKNELKSGQLARPRDENHLEPGLAIKIRYDGKVSIPDEDEYSYENSLVAEY